MHPKSETYHEITNLLEKGQFDKAQKIYESQKHKLSECETLECAGNFHFYNRRNQEAVNSYEAAMTRCTDYHCARYHYIVAVQLELEGKNAEAYERYNAAIQIEPSFVDAYVELGGLFFKLTDYSLAAKVYEDALAIDSNDLRIYANLVEVYKVLLQQSDDYKEKFKIACEKYAEAAKRLPPLDSGFKW